MGVCALLALSMMSIGGTVYAVPLEIARGAAWVSAYWGYNAPKLVYDGSAYYTAGLWGGVDAPRAVLYRVADGKVTPGWNFHDLYQPPVLALDAEKRLLVVYTRQGLPVRMLRASSPGQAEAFDELPPPPDMQHAYYIGLAVQETRLYLAYLDATNSMRLARLNMARMTWSPSVLLREGQVAREPKTAWTYPILAPMDAGVQVVASNCPDGGTGNTYNEVWHAYVPDEATGPVTPQKIAESPMGHNTFALDMMVDSEKTIHVLYHWNSRVYGEALPAGRAAPGLYHAWRKESEQGWHSTRLGEPLYAGLCVCQNQVWVLINEGTAIAAMPWQAQHASWGDRQVLLNQEELPVFPGFIDPLSASGNSTPAPGFAWVADGLLPGGTGPLRQYLLWGVFPGLAADTVLD